MSTSPLMQARQFLDFISSDGVIRELRVFSAESTPEKKDIWAGQFDNIAKMANAAAQMSEIHRAEAVYYSLNSVKPDRSFADKNKIIPHCRRTVQGVDIAGRDIFLIDCDPSRPVEFKKFSATDEEKARATLLAQMVRDYLGSQGFPKPIVLDSGNGGALLYRGSGGDAKTSQYEWAQCLVHLSEHFASFEGASVDKAVHDPNRISRMPGTWNRKGENTTDRPHRMAQVISYPSTWERVPWQSIAKLADNARKGIARRSHDISAIPVLKVSSKRVQRVVRSVLEDLIKEYPEIFDLDRVTQDEKYIFIALTECPFKGEAHTGQGAGHGKSCIMIDRQTAQMCFNCFSDDCPEYTFGSLMDLIEEEYGHRPLFSYCDEIMDPDDDISKIPFTKYVRESPWGWPLEARVNTMDLSYEDVEEQFLDCAVITDQHLDSTGNGHLRAIMRAWAQRVVACKDLAAAASLIGQSLINSIAFPCESRPLTDAELDALLDEIHNKPLIELRWVP